MQTCSHHPRSPHRSSAASDSYQCLPSSSASPLFASIGMTRGCLIWKGSERSEGMSAHRSTNSRSRPFFEPILAKGKAQILFSHSANFNPEGSFHLQAELSEGFAGQSMEGSIDFLGRKEAEVSGEQDSACSSPPASPGSSSSSSPSSSESSWFSSLSSCSEDRMDRQHSSNNGGDGGGRRAGDGGQGKKEWGDEEEEVDDGSVASRLLRAIAKSTSSPSLSACCKEVARETPFQKALRLRNLKLHHCTEELGSESCGDYTEPAISTCTSNVLSTYCYQVGQGGAAASNPPGSSATIVAPHSTSHVPAGRVQNETCAGISAIRLSEMSKVRRSRSMSDFPPPLISNSGCSSSATLLQPVRQDGRLVLKEVKAPYCSTYLHAARAGGRLTLYLPLEDPEQPALAENKHIRNSCPHVDSSSRILDHASSLVREEAAGIHPMLIPAKEIVQAAKSPKYYCSSAAPPRAPELDDQYSNDILLDEDDIDDKNIDEDGWDVAARAAPAANETVENEERELGKLEQASEYCHRSCSSAVGQGCPATYGGATSASRGITSSLIMCWQASTQENLLEATPTCYAFCSSSGHAIGSRPAAAPSSPANLALNASPREGSTLVGSLGLEALGQLSATTAASSANKYCAGFNGSCEGDDGIVTDAFQGARSLPPLNFPLAMQQQQQPNIAAHWPSSPCRKPQQPLFSSNHEWRHRLHCKELEYRNELLRKHKIHCVATRS